MATFRINFQAQTTGTHYIGYRTYDDPIGTYNVLTINVIGIVPQAVYVDIPVPGNLYCAYGGILYEGYIVAACQLLPEEVPSVMIPAAAITWSVPLLEQTDPCIKTNILCEATPISTVNWTGATSNCTPVGGPYPVVFTEVTPGDEILPASAEAFVTEDGALMANLIDPGLYKAPPTITIPAISNCSPDLVFTVIMDICPEINLTDYVCAGHTELSGIPTYAVPLGEDLELCTDLSTLDMLPTGYLATPGNNCHCEECTETIVSVGGTSGYVRLSYQKCWDDATQPGMLITRTIQWGTNNVSIGCILGDTFAFDISTLVNPGLYPVVHTHVPC